jgi:hypothetical protein
MINDIQKLYPELKFKKTDDFMWSPRDRKIHYSEEKVKTDLGKFSLLHEVGHALLNHETYDHDIDLLKYEVAAWEKAKEVSKKLKIDIDQDYIEDCLDSYRDWLKRRSTCPDCSFVNFQTSHLVYDCSWKVSASQICRIQRIKITT